MIPWLRYKLAWWRWFVRSPPILPRRLQDYDDAWRANRRILHRRWCAAEPKREDFR